MLLPLKWLAEFVDHGLSPEELAHALTMGGLEVDGIIERYAGLANALTCRVLEVNPHPDADKLRLATVQFGDQTDTVVCGAPNVAAGLVTVLATPGTVTADGMTVKKAKIRGVESNGMLMSKREMGMSDDHGGIIELPADTPLGVPAADALNLETHVLEISITPNRGDALSVLGVARDVAALTGRPLKLPEIGYQEYAPNIHGQAKVTVEDTWACPRYSAILIKDVGIFPSPIWMADRLTASGVRPISNVVDITNYVLMELGQPLHAFDFDQVAKSEIIVRTAGAGEKFVTLDGQERTLDEQMLLICDGEKAVGLAGVMGGLNSEITGDTRHVLLESAFFNPMSTRRTSKRLGLSTEASYRFERGVDREGCLRAGRRAAQLMALLANGQVAEGAIDVHPEAYQPARIPLSVSYTSRYLGLPLSREQVEGSLTALGLPIRPGPDADNLVVEAPAARTDLERPVDLTEEVARIVGFDNIPAKSPVGPVFAKPRAWLQRVRAKSRDLLAASGMDEALTYSFSHPKDVDKALLAEDDPRRRVVKLLNPLSEDQAVLRSSLLYGLLAAANRNLSHRVKDVALFEIGRTFIDRPGEELPEEPMRAAGVFCGLAAPASWWGGEVKASLAQAKGAVEYLAEGLELTGLAFEAAQAPSAYLDPDLALDVKVNGQTIGELGQLTAKAAANWDIELPVFYFDLHFNAIADAAPRTRKFAALPRFPGVSRDLALVLDQAVEAGKVLAEATARNTPWLEEVRIFDVYTGKPLDKNQKSLGLRFSYRDGERTLTEEEVLKEHDQLVAHLLETFQGAIRA